jgi:cation diffusion facilitator family transporter
MTDVWTGVAVLVGIAAVWLTGVQAFDPLVALLMAANILGTGAGLVRRSFNGLMDHALPQGEQAQVRAAIEHQLGAGMAYHALRTRQAGSRRFVDFHLLVPGKMSVKDAHAVIGRIETAVRGAFPGLEVSVHVEPIEERAAWEDSALLAVEEAARRGDAPT